MQITNKFKRLMLIISTLSIPFIYSLTPLTAYADSINKATVVKSGTTLKESSDLYSKTMAVLKSGCTVVIVEQSSDWCQVKFGKRFGYVQSKNLNIPNFNPSTFSTTSTTSTTSTMSTTTTTTVVTEPDVSIKYSKDYYYVDKGDSIDLGFANSGSISYVSSDSVSCPVSNTGIVQGVKEGLYSLTASNSVSSTSTCVVVLKEKYMDVTAMSISTKGTKFIANWEGGGTKLSSGETVFYPYKDVSGFWTLGYGHAKTSTASKSWSEEKAIEEFNKDIINLIGEEHIMTDEKPYISKEAANLLLNADLNDGPYVNAISNWAIRNGVKLNQAQFDALVSFCYNMGASYWNSDTNYFYLKSAIISHRSGDGADPNQIVEGFCRYIKSGGKNYKGLWYRRRNEAEMFTDGDYAIDRANKFTLPTNIVWA